MSLGRSSALLGAALVAATAGGFGANAIRNVSGADYASQAQSQKGTPQSQLQGGGLMQALLRGGGYGGVRRERRSGPGWTNRHVKRMALKKRNQARHKAACRGRAHA